MKNRTLKIDKREAVRCHTPEYIVSFEQEIGRDYGDIVDISAGGMQVKTVEKMRMGAVALQFKLPSFPKRRTVLGQVVWVDEKRCTYGIHFWHDLVFKKSLGGTH